jgi:DNA recombination protein RmuC
MEPVLIILIVLLIAINAFAVWKLLQPKEQKPENTEGLILLQKQIQDMSRTMDNRLSQTADKMYDSLKDQSSQSQRLIQDINRQVGEQLRDVVARTTEVGESSKQVFAVADQLKELQNILKNPKQRGILGEYYLETVLQNVLPPDSFQMQYAFTDGEIVDAVVFVKGKIIPIDSKFSLDNYNRFAEAADGVEKAQYEKVFVNDLKNRITETAKYIRPSEKTTDFAFMFIPHEGIYYDLLSNKVGAGEDNLIQRAAGKYKVIIVSPTSFLAYLQTVLQGLKAMEIEEKAQDIIKNVEKLTGHLKRYEEYYHKLGNTLATTVNHYNSAGKELGKIDKDVLRITGESADIEILSLEKPRERDEI